jgi:hypothetical protein
MNDYAIIFLLVSTIALLLIPRHWAPLPLLIGACYIPSVAVVQLGPLHFSAVRIVICAGLVRIIIRGERLTDRMNSLDWLMLVWALWAIFSGLFHKDPSAAIVNRLGLVYDACGIYLLIRVFCRSLDDVVKLCHITTILLVPLAIAMLYENLTRYDVFSALTDDLFSTEIRSGRIRAQGPFAHSILAGTVGAGCLPLIVALWHEHRIMTVIGIGACLVIVYASSSSGPIMSAMTAIGALFMWRWRHKIRLVRWLAVFGYILLDLVMKDPAYFIMARIDFVGGSTGWHRAKLIQASIDHLSEWWIVGTDYTLHWIGTGIAATAEHTDITNYYLQMGVIGGLPLMLLFIVILSKGFSIVGATQREISPLTRQYRFVSWALGASLFVHATTFISVSYFDQTVVFFYLTLAAISATQSETFMISMVKEERA